MPGDIEAKISRRNFLRLTTSEVERLEILHGDCHNNTGPERQKAADEIEKIFGGHPDPQPEHVPHDPQP